MLGMGDGEAHVIRNAGGVVTDDVVRSLAISQRLLGTTEIILIHHTDCGMQKTTEAEFKGAIEAETGIRPPWAVESFGDAEQDVRQSIGRLKASPFIPHKDAITGFVFDVDTGKLNAKADATDALRVRGRGGGVRALRVGAARALPRRP